MLKVDNEKLLNLIKSFYDLTHLKVSVYDETYTEIINYPPDKGEYYPQNIGLCSYITSTNAVECCEASNNCAFDKCRLSGKSVVYKCPFQMFDSVSPIIHNDTVIGYFMLGQVRDESDDFEKMIPKLEEYNLDIDVARDLYYKQPIMTKEVFKEAQDILHAISYYVYLIKIISQTPTDTGTRIEQFIDENIAKDISVDMLCKHLHYSRTNLYKIFEETFNQSIAQYIRNKRISKACTLLASTEESISVIATSVGIPDYNYFTKVFTKVMNVSPSKYKKKKHAEYLAMQKTEQ